MIGELAGLAAAACWAAGSLLFERIGRARASPGAMNLGKTTGAFVVLFAVSLVVHGGLKTGEGSPRELGLLAGSAVIGLTLGDTAFFGAIVRLGAAPAVLLLSTSPLFAVVLEALLRGAFPPLRELAGIGLTFAGVLLVIARRGASGARPSSVGVLLGVASALCQAVGSIMSRAATQGTIDPLTASWGRLLVGAVALTVFAAPSGHLGRWVRELARGGTFVRIGAASFVSTVCGLFLAQVALARATSAGVAATLLATSPIFALPLAHVTGSERATPRAVLGVAIAIAGIAVLTLGP